MMNQERFLQALRSRISMLEQAEQQDILAEYAQHIELLVQDGLTEEEAIRDFGPLDELAAEILEAYHIDPEYTRQTGEPVESPEKERRPNPLPGLWKRFTAACARLWKRFTAACARLWERVKNFFFRLKAKLRRKAAPEAASEAEPEVVPKAAPMKAAAVKRQPRIPGSTKKVLGRGWRKFCHGFALTCKTILWLGWNGMLTVCALPVAALVLVGAVVLGLVLVLLFQGLPLIGVLIMILGALLCCGGILGLGWTLIWHRRAPSAAGTDTTTMTVQEQIRQTVESVREEPEEEEAHHDA